MPGKQDIRAGRAFVELMLKDAAFVRGLKKGGEQLKSFGTAMAGVGAKITAIGAGITAPFLAALNHFATFGSVLNDMSVRTGVSAQALAEFGFAAEQTGASLPDVEKGIKGVAKSLFDAEQGSSASIEAFAALGVEWQALIGLKPEEQFEAVAEALNRQTDASKKQALAQAVLGRAGRQLIPMLEDMAALRQEARDLGLVPTDEAVRQADQVGDALDRVRRAAGAILFEVGAALAEPALQVFDIIKKILVATNQWIRDNQQLVIAIAGVGAVVLSAGVAITGLGLSLAAVGFAMTGIAAALSVVFSPLTLLIATVAAATAAWLTFTESGQAAVESVTGWVQGLVGTVTDTLGAIVAAIRGGNVELAGKIAIAGLRVAWRTGLDAMLGGWREFLTDVVSGFARAMESVITAWGKVTGEISATILASAASGGLLGKIALAGTAVGGGQIQIRPEDLPEAQRIAKEIINQQVKELGGTVAEFESGLKKVIGTDAEAEAALAAAKEELANLKKQARELRPDRLPGSTAKAGGLDEELEAPTGRGVQSRIFGTFSAAAFAIAGLGQTRQEKLIRTVEEVRDAIREKTRLDKLQERLKQEVVFR